MRALCSCLVEYLKSMTDRDSAQSKSREGELFNCTVAWSVAEPTYLELWQGRIDARSCLYTLQSPVLSARRPCRLLHLALSIGYGPLYLSCARTS